MFYKHSLIKDLNLLPQNLDNNIKELISTEIRKIEGTVLGEYGYVVNILEFNQLGDGIVENDSGNVIFKVDYKAITFKPIKGEILKAIPVFINEHGFYCQVGPLQIFVSQHMLDDFQFDPNETIWVSEYEKIEINRPINLEILATQINSDKITALGRITTLEKTKNEEV